MRSFKHLLLGAASIMALGLTACQDDFDDMPEKVPAAQLTPNTTIAEFKDAFWKTETNYCGEVGTREDGTHYIISGRVLSSDEDGNIFKCLYIRDESAALPISINRYNLYLNYRIGQEIVIDLTEMYAGKYNGMFQLGYPEWYDQGNCYETSFMAPELFYQHAELNGLPEPDKITPELIRDLSEINVSDADDLKKWQGQLVRFNDCVFENPGEALCDEYHSSGYNQKLIVNGGSINVRTSGYAKFWNYKIPDKRLDVVGVLGFYSGDWQLLLRSTDDLMNIGDPTENLGTEKNPYTVPQVIEIESASQQGAGWVTGYIVGAVAPEVEKVTSSSDIEWTADVVMNNTLVIAPDADCTDITKCLVISLPQNSPLRQYGNLVDNPANYKKQIWVIGNFGKYMDTWGIIDNAGGADQFKIDGVTIEGTSVPAGDGQEATPWNISQVISGTASGTSTWVKGYIVGWVEGQVLSSGAHFDASATVKSNVLLANTPDETDLAKCIPVQLPVGDLRNAINLQDNPGNYKKAVALLGSIEKYFGKTGVKSPTEYKLDGAGTVTPPTGDTRKFTKATNVTGGKAYMFTTGDKTAAKPADAGASYGWLYTENVTASAGVINAKESLGFVFTATAGGYYISDSYGRYLYMSGDFNSFQLSRTLNASDKTYVWTVEPQADGTVKITNTGNSKWIQYSAQYTSFGAYPSETGVLPVLYEMEGTPSVKPGDEPGGDTPSTGAGSENEPWSVTQVISGAATGTSTWVEGYIVGWIDGKTLADGARFNADATVATNVILAASADETDLSKCIPVQLPSGEVRNALNLQNNPGNYKKHVKLCGSVEKYFGTMGLKSVSKYVVGGSTKPDTPTPGDGGTETSPWTVEQIIAGTATGTGVWTKGYIVGWVEGQVLSSGAHFDASATVKTNLLLAPSADVTDLSKCIPVQLPSGAVRNALNLQDNPGNYKKEVMLKGNVERYFGSNGFKTVTEYKTL